MEIVMVWVLVLGNVHGGIVTVNNIRSWEDCERMRRRAEAVESPTIGPSAVPMLVGSCTEIGVLAPKTATPPVINAQPSAAPAPVTKSPVDARTGK